TEQKKDPEKAPEATPPTPDVQASRDEDDGDLGLVKATQTVLLVVKGEQSGQPVENALVKFVENDPELPVAEDAGQPATAPKDAYAADVAGGTSTSDGSVRLASAPADSD